MTPRGAFARDQWGAQTTSHSARSRTNVRTVGPARAVTSSLLATPHRQAMTAVAADPNPSCTTDGSRQPISRKNHPRDVGWSLVTPTLQRHVDRFHTPPSKARI